MDKFEFAKLIDGQNRRKFPLKEVQQQAKDNELLFIFGRGDDIVEICGVICEEVDGYEGVKFYLTMDKKKEVVYPISADRGESPWGNVYIDQWRPRVEIEAIWQDEEYPSWIIKTELPHATFMLVDEDSDFCQGIVLEKKQIIQELSKQVG